MKSKPIRKLSLSKSTISNLQADSMDVAKGGRPRESVYPYACQFTLPGQLGCPMTYNNDASGCTCPPPDTLHTQCFDAACYPETVMNDIHTDQIDTL